MLAALRNGKHVADRFMVGCLVLGCVVDGSAWCVLTPVIFRLPSHSSSYSATIMLKTRVLLYSFTIYKLTYISFTHIKSHYLTSPLPTPVTGVISDIALDCIQ